MAKNTAAVRTPVRPDAPEAAEREPVRAKVRTRKGLQTSRYHIPDNMIPDGIDLQWNTDSILGQPTAQERSEMERQGWEAVTSDMFEGRFDGIFTRKGQPGEINVGGLVLMWRPIELTLEARAEELHEAQSARRAEENKMTSGAIDGVDPNFLDAKNPHARAGTFLRKEHGPSMPIRD